MDKLVNTYTAIHIITYSYYISFIMTQFIFAPDSVITFHDYAKSCAPTIKCDANAKYRSINGSCNNLIIPWMGAFKTPHLRLFDAYYEDGVYEFRKQTDGNPLPNVRQIQLEVFMYKQFPFANDHNVLFMEWGQFIAHDTTNLPPDVSVGSDCCELQNENPVPIQCQAVIKVPKNDPVYMKNGQTCINFHRAQTSVNDGCPMKPVEFMVQATHYIDGSLIYGSNNEVAANLRSFRDGQLKSDYFEDGQEFCPQTNRSSFKCGSSQQSNICYFSGDPRRINQNIGIAILQNMFLRFHNIVAHHLRQLNPFWNDEITYQETRRMVIAVIQHITYTHYLPILLGETYATLNGFDKQTIYDDTVNPSTTIEFSTGAFRILHNQIPQDFNLIDTNHYDYARVILTDWMDRPDILPLSNNFDELLRGFIQTPTRLEQPSYNPLISNYLFRQTTPKIIGHDLFSTDIQRGRDTGMPPYNKLRSICGIPKAKSFDDLTNLIAYEAIQKLKGLYSSVDDIDFIVGALLEIPAKGAKMGPTARCVIADSFYRYKTGDRYFYDVQGQPGTFTSEQLKTIKKLDFGHIICATSNIQYLPANIFMPLNNRFNGIQYSCNLFTLNLNAWKL